MKIPRVLLVSTTSVANAGYAQRAAELQGRQEWLESSAITMRAAGSSVTPVTGETSKDEQCGRADHR